jgi:hypothetical protein
MYLGACSALFYGEGLDVKNISFIYPTCIPFILEDICQKQSTNSIQRVMPEMELNN